MKHRWLLIVVAIATTGVRIGVDEAYCTEHVDPAVREAVLAAVEVLKRLGADVRPVTSRKRISRST